MANEAGTSLVGMAEAFGIVAGVSVAVAVVAVGVARALKLPLVPTWRAPGAVWPGGVVIGLFLAYYVAMPETMKALDRAGAYQKLCGPDFPPLTANAPEKSDVAAYAKWSGENQLRAIWAGFLVVPLLVLATVLLRAAVLKQPPSLSEYARPLPGRVATGIGLGLFLVPLTFAVHAVAVWTAEVAEVAPDRHPLTTLILEGEQYAGLVIGLSVILVVPLVEELLFRGLVVNWASGDWYRPWVVMAFAGLLAGLRGVRFAPEFGPTVFLALLAVGLYLMQRFAFQFWPTFPTRTAAAVWSSAALFAAAHAPIWPSPIPLFVLGLGLGYLTARTRDITAAVVVHGMFNAVSFTYLLRGGMG